MSLGPTVPTRLKNGRLKSTPVLSKPSSLVLLLSKATTIRNPSHTLRISGVSISLWQIHLTSSPGSHKTPEAAVTSDEEAGVSGDEAKRPKGWTRRISGSFGKLTGGSKEAPKDVPVVAPTESTADTAAEAAVVETPAVAETTEPAATETPAEAPPADGTTFLSCNSNVPRY